MTAALNLGLLGNNVNTSGQVSLTAGVSGTLPVANGGTGAATLAANNVLLGNGTSALQAVAPSTSGNVLTSNGTTWTSAAPASPNPSTTQVLNATAGASVGAVGTYGYMFDINLGQNLTRAPGSTLAGSNLRYAGSGLLYDSYTATWTATPAAAGTWRLMGYSAGVVAGGCGPGSDGRISLWLRIS